jgi:hypothetical protein
MASGSRDFTQFATAWVTPWVGEQRCQILVYVWREPDVFVVRHMCWYKRHGAEFTRRWEPDKRREVAAYFGALKEEGPARREVEKMFKKYLGEILDVNV